MIRRIMADRVKAAATNLRDARYWQRRFHGAPDLERHADREVVRARRRYDRWRTLWTWVYGWDS